jgi:hypothetical protein
LPQGDGALIFFPIEAGGAIAGNAGYTDATRVMIENHQVGTAVHEGSSARVRANAGGAAIAAALLIYFGFFRLVEPSGTDLFDRAGWVFYHTVRLGGVIMAGLSAASLLGHPAVLVLDCAASLVIGALLGVTGLVMKAAGGGIEQLIISVFCGGLFISSGLRNGRDYLLISRARRGAAAPASGGRNVEAIRAALPPMPPAVTMPANAPVGRSAATALLAQRRAGSPSTSAPGEPPARPPRAAGGPVDGSPPPEGSVLPDVNTAPVPPPGESGYLASFGESGPPPRS